MPSLTLALGVGLAYAFSYMSQALAARAFGADARMDAYFLAAAMPGTCAQITASLVSYRVVPFLVRSRDGDRHSENAPLVITGAFALGAAIALAGIALAPLQLMVSGGSALSPATRASAVAMARVSWVQTGLFIASTGLDAEQYAAGRAGVPALAFSVPYVGAISGLMLVGDSRGPIALCWGSAIGVAIGVAVRRCLWSSEPSWRVAWAARRNLRPITEDLGGAVGGILLLCAPPIIDAFWAPRLANASLTHLAFASRLTLVVASTVVLVPSVFLVPDLVRSLRSQDETAFREAIDQGIRLAWFSVMPLTVLLLIVRTPLLTLAFQRGNFTAKDVLGVAMVVKPLAIALVPMVAVIVLVRALYAAERQWTAARAGGLALTTQFIAAAPLGHWLGTPGLAWAQVLAWAVALLEMGRGVFGASAPRHVASTLRSVALTGSLTALAYLATGAVSPFHADGAGALGAAALVVQILSRASAFLGVFLGLALLCRAPEARWFVLRLQGLRRPRKLAECR